MSRNRFHQLFSKRKNDLAKRTHMMSIAAKHGAHTEPGLRRLHEVSCAVQSKSWELLATPGVVTHCERPGSPSVSYGVGLRPNIYLTIA